MGRMYKLSAKAQARELERVLQTLAKHEMDFRVSARELGVSTAELFRFVSRNPLTLDAMFSKELDRLSRAMNWIDGALQGEHGFQRRA